jgi:hypothetical protein
LVIFFSIHFIMMTPFLCSISILPFSSDEVASGGVSGGVANGMDVSDDSVEGVAAGADGEDLVCRVGVVGLRSSVGGGGDVLVKEFDAGGVLI